MILAWMVAAVILVALVIYGVLGGADFGGGFWDLFASGPRAQRQRALIEQAIAPVWEANHVWLIVVIVLLFTNFPLAFASVSIALHVPLALMLLGIVFRASAFVFRQYDVAGDSVQRRWGRVFAWSSIITPLFLGIVVATLSTGNIRVIDGVVQTGYFGPWVRPFPIVVGIFTLALFAFLAATYLIRETTDPELREDFCRRALWAQGGVVVLGVVAAWLAGSGAAEFRRALFGSVEGWIVVAIGVVLAAISTWMLVSRRTRWARVFAGAEVAAVIVGWGVAQQPYLVYPDITIPDAAAPARTHAIVLIILAAGSVILIPSLWWLYRIFKREPIFEELSGAPARERERNRRPKPKK